jgi:hypothetical protein
VFSDFIILCRPGPGIRYRDGYPMASYGACSGWELLHSARYYPIPPSIYCTFIELSFPRCNPSARGDKCRHDHPSAHIIIIIIEALTHATNIIFKVIGLHTLISVYWPNSTPSLLSAIIIMSLVWLYVILFVAIGIGLNGSKDYEIPTPVCTTY